MLLAFFSEMVPVANTSKPRRRGTRTSSSLLIVGSGGNINKLNRLAEHKDRRLQRMTVATLKELHESLAALTVEERMAKYDLKPDRADVIVPAGNIFLLVSRLVSATYIYVPVIGLSDGIIDEIYEEHKAQRARELMNAPRR